MRFLRLIPPRQTLNMSIARNPKKSNDRLIEPTDRSYGFAKRAVPYPLHGSQLKKGQPFASFGSTGKSISIDLIDLKSHSRCEFLEKIWDIFERISSKKPKLISP